ncbi:MAG TPA: hypothetical protein VNC40_15420 [Gaiellaceae bacterium]|nr:hypothetical protein [Gaiellaceae bacterium]
MTGAIAIAAGGALIVVGVMLATNFRGVGGRVAMFGGAITFLFDGGQTLRRPERGYRVWGSIIVVGGLLAVVIGLAKLTG